MYQLHSRSSARIRTAAVKDVSHGINSIAASVRSIHLSEPLRADEDAKPSGTTPNARRAALTSARIASLYKPKPSTSTSPSASSSGTTTLSQAMRSPIRKYDPSSPNSTSSGTTSPRPTNIIERSRPLRRTLPPGTRPPPAGAGGRPANLLSRGPLARRPAPGTSDRPSFARRTGPGDRSAGRPGQTGTSTRPRAPRDRKERRKRTSGGPGDVQETSAEDYIATFSDETIAYLLGEQRKEMATVDFLPREGTSEALKGASGALPLGEEGVKAVVEEFLRKGAERKDDGFRWHEDLAKRLINGRPMKFISEEEKVKVLATANQLSAQMAAEISKRKGETIAPKVIDFAPMGEEDRKETLERLVGGRYPDLGFEGKGKGKGSEVLRTVARVTSLNGSYRARDNGRILGKVREFVGSQ